MYNSFQWAKRLNALLENNFFVAKCYKKTSEKIEDVQLKNYLQKQASKRTQFAFELGQEIKFLGCAPFAKSTVIPFRTQSLYGAEENPVYLLTTCIKIDKHSIKEYKKSLSRVNHGSSREILMRHKSIIEATRKEMKNLKLELNLNKEEEIQLKKIQ